MKDSFQAMIGDNSSPLFRIMSGYDIGNNSLRRFENNICTFHIGNGIFLSVAHSLIFYNNIPRSLVESEFNSLISSSSTEIQQVIRQNFSLDENLNKYRWNENVQNVNSLIQLFPQINYDTRYPSLFEKNICKPYLLLQFKEKALFSNSVRDDLFTDGRYFLEPDINRHTFLVDLILHKVLEASDIAIYKIDPKFNDIVAQIPSVNVDYNLYEIGEPNYYCLQGAPINELGRMIHKSQIEGFINHFSPQIKTKDRNYIFEGDRYLIKGYFRFGSSGAPYLYYDNSRDLFAVNAIQSEACPLQMLIQGNRDNSAQYVNAIATPLSNVKSELDLLQKER